MVRWLEVLEMLEMLEGLDGWSKCRRATIKRGRKRWLNGQMVGYHITGALQKCLPRLETAGPDAIVMKSVK